MKRSGPLRRYAPLLAKTALKRVSVKQGRKNREWSQLKARAIAERGDVCEVGLLGCRGSAEEAHHVAGRSVQTLAALLLCCGPCHRPGIHGNPERAYERGWMVKRNQ